MGGVNSIPVVSQAKSGVQLICGDSEGAAQTQKDFVQQCPVVSQITSTVQLISGDVEGAIETQKKCGDALLRTADGIPLIGHAKGAIHYACGDKEGGNRAMMSATRTTGVMGAGAAGFLVGGPVGAIAGGVAGGTAFDTSVTVIDSVAHDEYRPSGYYAAIGNVIKNPNPGDIFDTCFMPVGDGLAGYSGGRLVNRFAGGSTSSGASGGQPPPPGAAELAKATALEAQADAIMEAAESGKMNMPSGEYLRMANEAKAVWQQAQDLKGAPPPVDIKVSTTPSPPVTVTVVGPVDIPAQNEDDQTKTIPLTVVETWVLWLTDKVFVVGTDKAIVELVTAFLLKDISLLEEICKELGIDPKIIFGNEYASLTFTKIVELALNTQSIHGLSQKNFLELIKKTGKKGRKAVQQFFSNLFQQAEKTKKKEKRSKRGEHVINNGVLNVYRDIMGMFLLRSGITTDGLGALSRLSNEESQVLRDCTNYFDHRTRTDIQEVLKVFIDEDTAYIDANALLYGSSIYILRTFAVEHMMELYGNSRNEGSRHTRPLKETVSTINDKLLYVDQHALSIWITRSGPDGRFTFERARNTVQCMFDELYEKLGQWIRELKSTGYIRLN